MSKHQNKNNRSRTGKSDSPYSALDAQSKHLARAIYLLFKLHTEARSSDRVMPLLDWAVTHAASWSMDRARRGQANRSVWERLARMCLEEDLDPAAFVEAHFQYDFIYRGLPLPSSLLGDASVSRCREYAKTRKEGMAILLDSQLTHLRTEIFGRGEMFGDEEDRAAFLVLAGRQNDLTPLFRYCAAHRVGNAEIQRMFRVEAEGDYILHRYAYDQGWSDWIPESLRVAADLLWKRLLRLLSRGGADDPEPVPAEDE